MIHRPSAPRRVSGLRSALALCCFVAGDSSGVRAVPANPPAKSELGGAAVRPTPAANPTQSTGPAPAVLPPPASPTQPPPAPGANSLPAGNKSPAAVPAATLAGASPTSPAAPSPTPVTTADLTAAKSAAPTLAADNASPAVEIQGLLRLGTKLAERGDYSTAEIAFWQILHRKDVPVADQFSALLGLARMYRKENSLTKAVAIYERLIKDHPDEDRIPDTLLELGRTLREMSAYRMAFNAFYSVINSTLKFGSQGFQHYVQLAHTAQFEIAQTHFEAGEYAEAGAYFLKVRNLDLAPPDQARAAFMAAYSEQLAGELNPAVSTLRSFLDEWPGDQNAPEARYLLATLLRQLKRPQEAMHVTLDLLRNVHASDQANPRLWSYWQRKTGNEIANDFFQTGDILNALAIYQGLDGLAQTPDWRMPVTYQIGLCYERLEQADRATAAYETVIAAGTPKPNGPPPAPELADLARMATWRLAHLRWRDTTEHQFSQFFHDDSGDPSTAEPPNGAPSINDPSSPPPT